MRRAQIALLALLCLAGCGGGGASGGDGPASAVPRDAAFYAEATIRPEGELREDALAAAGKVLRSSDPSARIRELVDEALAESGQPKLDYARDVEPWLGDTAAVWGSARGDEAIAVLAAEDPDAAQEAIDRAASGSEKAFAPRSHRGVDYQVNDEGEGVAVVEDFALFGPEAGIRRSIDALEGDALADSDRFQGAIEKLEDEHLGHYFVDLEPLVDAAFREDAQARQLAPFRSALGLDRIGPIAGAFRADGSALELDSVASLPDAGLVKRFAELAGGGATPLLGELPGDSWAAFGAPRLGETARTVYTQVGGALGAAVIGEQLRSELGIDLEQDVFSWIGDVAFFARGTSADAIEGGAVIEVTDAERGRAAFAKLVGVAQTRGGVRAKPIRVRGAETAFELRGATAGNAFASTAAVARSSDRPVIVARSESRVVVASSVEAAADALDPPAQLSDAPAFEEAEALMDDGMEPSFLLDVAAVVAIAELTGGDADFRKAKPYLEAFSVFAGGARSDDDLTRSRLAAGLK